MDSKVNPVVHFEIGCKDLKKTSEFYQKTFGWDITAEPSSAQINTNADSGIQGHLTALGHEPHNYINFYIEVEDITGILDIIETNGGKTLIGPVEIPGGQQFAWFKDVAGNTLGLITKK